MGSWQINEVCDFDPLLAGADPEVPDCPEASIKGSDFQLKGPVVFSEDGTYSVSITVDGSVDMNIPADCLKTEFGNLQLTCQLLTTVLSAALASDSDAPFESVTCKGSGNCTCTAQLLPQESTETGTYVVSGSTVILTDSEGDAQDASFCVKGSSMALTLQEQGAEGESFSGGLKLTRR